METTNTRITGKIVYANVARGFFFVEVKLSDATLQRYYLHCSRIRRCFPENPEKGCFVTFVPGPKNSARPTDFPSALEADVYWPQMQQSQTSQSPSAPKAV